MCVCVCVCVCVPVVQQAVHHDHGRPRRLAHLPVVHSQRPAPAGPAGAEAKSAKAAKMATMVIVYGAWLFCLLRRAFAVRPTGPRSFRAAL